jgi:hypothetical protein
MVAEQISVMSMLSLSEAYNSASGGERESFRRCESSWPPHGTESHYIGLIWPAARSSCSITPCTGLRWFRALAAFGMAAALLQIVAVAMPSSGTACYSAARAAGRESADARLLAYREGFS